MIQNEIEVLNEELSELKSSIKEAEQKKEGELKEE
jgi:hypothetical protein